MVIEFIKCESHKTYYIDGLPTARTVSVPSLGASETPRLYAWERKAPITRYRYCRYRYCRDCGLPCVHNTSIKLRSIPQQPPGIRLGMLSERTTCALGPGTLTVKILGKISVILGPGGNKNCTPQRVPGSRKATNGPRGHVPQLGYLIMR